MNIVMTTGHRTGSRWVHYLLSDLLEKSVTPERGDPWLRTISKRNQVIKDIKDGKLVKFHAVMPDKLLKLFPDLDMKVLCIVRNPRDRAVSFAFHNRYHNKTHFKQKDFNNDKEAVQYTVFKDRLYKKENTQQFKTMLSNLSTRNYSGESYDYVWTCYEWLKEDTFREIKKILELSKINKSDAEIIKAINNNSFKAKSSRQTGEEDRKDLWRRKGINGDWENWFDKEMTDYTQKDNDKYYELLSLSGGES